MREIVDAPHAGWADLRLMAEAAICAAGRPAGTCPTIIAFDLAVLAVPCAAEDAAILEPVISTNKFRYAWLDEPDRRAVRVWLGLARVLLLRAGRRLTRADTKTLARLLESKNSLDAS